jgi:predicted nucleic acid-binding protein
VLYLDSSAFVKLVAKEEHSAALRKRLTGGRWVGSELLRTEAHRALARLGLAKRWQAQVDDLLARTALVIIDRELLEVAARLGPPTLRTLDAIHLASALRVDGVQAFVTYDERLMLAAQECGRFEVLAPGRRRG